MNKAAGILFVADGKVLLLKRSAGLSHGKEWALPGGGVEGNETPEQAARREFSEECGYTYTGELSPIMTTNDGQVEYTTFIARCDSFQPKLNEEHTAFLWSDIDDYPNKTHPAVKALLDTDKARDEIISSAALDCRADADFKEGDHPRAENGQFGSGGSSDKHHIMSDKEFDYNKAKAQMYEHELKNLKSGENKNNGLTQSGIDFKIKNIESKLEDYKNGIENPFGDKNKISSISKGVLGKNKGKEFKETAEGVSKIDYSEFLIKKSLDDAGIKYEKEDSALSQSRYLTLEGGEKIRISDHPIPNEFVIKHGKPTYDVTNIDDAISLVGKLKNKSKDDLSRSDAAEVITELDIAKKIRDGVLTSPQQYKNISIFALRISGTGISYRAKLDEYVNRLPENYLSEEFLQRCNGLPVIWVHPPGDKLDSDSFAERVIGTICLPYIAGDEVWGIAKIWDTAAAQQMSEVQMSTSPGVMFQAGTNSTVKLNDGSHVLIEGKPSLLDHLAIVENGVWDKGGEPSGVLVENAQVVMTEASVMDSTDSSCSTLGETSMADNENPVATEPTNPVETEMMALLRQIAGDQKGIITRLEALEAAEAAEVSEVTAAAPAAAVPDAAPAAVAASPAANMPAPVLPVNQAAAKPDAAPCATEPTVSKKDFDEVKGRLDSVAAALEQSKADAEPEKEKAFADAQGRADEVEQMYGDSAPRKLAGDTVMSYEKRQVMKHLPRSKRWNGTNIEAISDPVIFAKIRDEVYADSMKAATSCEGIADGQVRAVTKTEGGCTTTKFLGKKSFTTAHTMRAM